MSGVPHTDETAGVESPLVKKIDHLYRGWIGEGKTLGSETSYETRLY